MAGYRGGGGGGGGASVVPATVVSASLRGDYPLTDAGIRAAMTALIAAGGGTLYLGQDGGTPVNITSALPEITVPMKIVGAGRVATRLNIVGAFSLFSIGDDYTSFEDFTVLGDNGATAQVVWTFTAAAADFFTQCNVTRVNVNTSPFGVTTGRVRTIFDYDNRARYTVIRDCYFGVGTGGAASASYLFLDASTSRIVCDNLWATIGAGISGSPNLIMTDCTISAAISTQVTSIGGVFTRCSFAGVTSFTSATFIDMSPGSLNTGTIKVIGGFVGAVAGSEPEFQGDTTISGATLTGDILFTGAGRKVISGCIVSSGLAESIINVEDQDGLVAISGCVGSVVVVETGTSDNNRYSGISPDSTLLGASSVVSDVDSYAWSSPGTLTTTDNALFPRYSPQVATMVRLLEVNVETAPTGAAIEVDFRVGDKATGVLGAVIGTVTVAINAFTGSVEVSPAVVLEPDEFIVPEITQVGSTIPGSNAAMIARA